MNHPNIENIRILADTFLILHESGAGKVDMQELKYDYACGTVACHAGWFGIAYGKGSYFFDSASWMAKFLGFSWHYHLRRWAKSNPEIWGNEDGDRIFSDSLAFATTPEKLTLEKVGIHWHKVADRLESLE